VASADDLAVALLAAGRSTRFGDADKLTAPLGDRPLIEWAADAGRAINAAQHFLVSGPGFPQHFLPQGYAPVPNPDAAEGMATSLRIAARHAREIGASALLILLGDMPLVTAEHLAVLLAAFARDRGRPVFSRVAGGAPQPPAIFPATLFPALEALSGDAGARSLAQDAAFVEAPETSLIDIDTPEDLARCEQLLET